MNKENILKGLVPWSKKEFQEVNKKLGEQLKKPKDDWDVQTTVISGGNPFHPMNIVSTYLHNRYPKQEIFTAHFLRYNNIVKFLRTYENDLIKEGLMNKTPKRHLIKDELIESLCTLPFSSRGEGQPVFSYTQVVERTWALLKKQDK